MSWQYGLFSTLIIISDALKGAIQVAAPCIIIIEHQIHDDLALSTNVS